MRRVLLCLAACLLLATGCDDARSSEAPLRPARIEDLAMAPVDLTKRCPASHHKPVYAPGGRLPEGAILVRLCSGWISKRYARAAMGYSYDDPREALTQGVQELVDQINTLASPAPAPSGVRTYCADIGGTPMEFWFGYPGGRTAVARWDTGGCRLVRLGSETGFLGGRSVRDAFSIALARQRRSARRPGELRPPRCNPSLQALTPLKSSTLAPLASATYCVLDDRGRWRSASVPPRVVRQINREAEPNHPGRGCATTYFAQLRARTIYGDRVDLTADSCEWSTPQGYEQAGRPRFWRPSVTLTRALAALPLGPPHWQRKPDGTILR